MVSPLWCPMYFQFEYFAFKVTIPSMTAWKTIHFYGDFSMNAYPDFIADPGCCICRELRKGRSPLDFQRKTGLPNRILAETENFAAFPSLSPIVVGHILLVPKHHISSIAQLHAAFHTEFKTFISTLLRRISARLEPPIVLEHGIGNGKIGGCGISHAHLHLLPLSPSVAARVNSQISRSFLFSQLQLAQLADGTHNDDSYLLFGLKPEELSVAFQENVPSQYFRKIIATQLGLERWDWREKFGWDDIRTTYDVLAAS